MILNGETGKNGSLQMQEVAAQQIKWNIDVISVMGLDKHMKFCQHACENYIFQMHHIKNINV